MFLDFDNIRQLAALAEQRIGVLEFHCETLGVFDGVEEDLEKRLRPKYRQRGREAENHKPGMITQFMSSFSDGILSGAKSAHASLTAEHFWRNTKALMIGGRYKRAMADLNDRELAVLRATCAHTLAQEHNSDVHGEFLRFMFQLNVKLVWAGGRGQYIPSDKAANFPAEAHAAFDLANNLMQRHIGASASEYEQEIGNWLGQYVQASQHVGFAQQHPDSARAIASVVQPSTTAWATTQHVLSGNMPFKQFEAGRDLFLGELHDQGQTLPIGFAGNESLVTVAQPGAGKTQCHILPNLLTYDGPIVALDPKLELLELTASKRQAEGKRILVLSLADDEQPTHIFNVMEFIDTRPTFMWGALVELAEFLLPAAQNDHNPIFRNKAAEMFAVCLGGVLLEAKDTGSTPTLPQAITRIFSSVEGLKNFFHDTEDRAGLYGCEPLEQSAASLAALANNENTLEDFQRYQSNATSVLNKYRGGLIDRVTNGTSDWQPQDLRQPGTTLYIRCPYEEMTVYGGFIRMVLYTIIKHLRRAPTEQGELPITFLLDEVAQFGNLDQIANVIETGRGFGLRVWLIFQDYDQAKSATSKPNLLLKTPRVRLFMNPTLETAQDMSAELGKLNQVITGKEKSLAEPAELMGEGYAENIIVLSSGSRPLKLQKRFAWQGDKFLQSNRELDNP